VAAAVAARLVDRRPRTGLVLAGLTATTGCLGVAVATDPAAFVVAVLVGGMGGGFASPALVPVLDSVVAPRRTATAQSVANAGTAVGVVGAGLVAFATTSVGPAWTSMAAVCALATVAVLYPVRRRDDLATLPKQHHGREAGRGGDAGAPAHRRPGAWRELVLPGVGAVVAGAGSALIWTFGPLLITRAGAVAPEEVGWLWIALGVGGLLGGFTGALVERIGRRGAWLAFAGALALASATVAVSVSTGSPWAAHAGMAVFGAGYMGLSGVLILWARHVWPDNAGAGTSVLFIALATGQALGSAGSGMAQRLLDPALLSLLAAGLCVAGGLTALVSTRSRRQT
jgi:predicted MFS family arabinose efflux permease